jgi:hypothetical protein
LLLPLGCRAAALFLTAGAQRLGLLRAPEYPDYAKRVENDRDLRLALMPFLANRQPE